MSTTNGTSTELSNATRSTGAPRVFPVPEKAAEGAHITPERYEEMYRRSVEAPEEFWAEQAKKFLSWDEPWTKVVEHDYTKGEIKWFLGAKLNVCFNCVDRHLPQRANQRAILWEGNEPGETRALTYAELYREVCRFANVLRELGIKKGDRVAIYLPMVPEAPIAMLACARIGAVHSVIFAGFSADSIRDRVKDSSCKVVITANEMKRGPKVIALKKIVDEALADVSCVERVLVVNRTPTEVPLVEGRDRLYSDEVKKVADECPYEPMDSEDPLFILYTSGSTGKPKGLLHTQGGYLLYAALTHKYVFDYREGEVYCCAADVGWITGHSYVVYGPLANGATTLLFESVPTYPDSGRYWDMVARHKVNILYTAPTAIRAIAREGDEFVKRHDRSSLRILGSVGEPINADAWLWYYNVVGEGRCRIVDTWWQTETGGILISPLPGVTPLKPGSATKPLFGVRPILVTSQGMEVKEPDVEGMLCMTYPWPGQARTVYGDHARFVQTYFSQYPGKYFTGDAARCDVDGDYWIIGRVDDVLNVSGHRIGTAEIESAIVQSGIVAEAAVVGYPHPIKGTGIFSYSILKPGVEPDEQATQKVREAVRKGIGAFAAPDVICFVPGLPKTRSGKIMRRILRKIAEGETESLGDLTTLADPAVVESIVALVGASGKASEVRAVAQ